MNKLKIVFVAFSDNTLGRRILNGLVENDHIPSHIFMANETAKKEFRKKGVKRYFKSNGIINTLWRVYYRLTLRKDVKVESIQQSQNLKKSIQNLSKDFNIPLSFFDNINSDHFVEKLKNLSPDLIVLGGAPLIKQNVISIPRIAVLNSHPGILPNAKGMDVVAHSILDKVPLGGTVFKVDEGMDSGPILLMKEYKESIEGLKLFQIESKIEEHCANLMLESIEIILKGNYKFEPQSGEGKIYKAITRKVYKSVSSKLLQN